MNDDETQEMMQTAADVVARKLRQFLTPAALEGFDCDDVLTAAQEWLLEDDADVATLRQAIQKSNMLRH